MQRPTFTATAVIEARRNAEQNTMEVNLVDAKGNTQNLILDNVAAGHLLAAMLQKTTGSDNLPEIHLNESIPLYQAATFRLPGYAGLRMYVNPRSVIDFVFAEEYFDGLKQMFGRAANPAP